MQRAKAGEAAEAVTRGGAGEAGAATASIEDVARWGTAGGAAVLDLPGVGTLAPGQAADLAPEPGGARPQAQPARLAGQVRIPSIVYSGQKLKAPVRIGTMPI